MFWSIPSPCTHITFLLFQAMWCIHQGALCCHMQCLCCAQWIYQHNPLCLIWSSLMAGLHVTSVNMRECPDIYFPFTSSLPFPITEKENKHIHTHKHMLILKFVDLHWNVKEHSCIFYKWLVGSWCDVRLIWPIMREYLFWHYIVPLTLLKGLQWTTFTASI